MLKIYGPANSINVRKVLRTVDEIGLPYTRQDWGRGYRLTTDPEFLKLDPFAVVPVTHDDGFILRESHAISRYLAAKHGRTDLYPTDPKKRAQVEAWMDWGQTDLPGRARTVPGPGRENTRLPKTRSSSRKALPTGPSRCRGLTPTWRSTARISWATPLRWQTSRWGSSSTAGSAFHSTSRS